MTTKGSNNYKFIGIFWNLLESSPVRILLIELSYKWTRLIFIVSNSKLRFRNFSQPIIDANSQSNLYDVLTLDHTRLCPIKSTNYIIVTHYIHSSSSLRPFHASIKKIIPPCIHCWQELIVKTTHAQNLEFIRCQYQTSPPQKRSFKLTQGGYKV